MPSTQTIVIAAVAGVAVIGGAAYLATNGLNLGSNGIRSVDLRNTPIEVVGTACADPQLVTAGVTKIPLHDGAYQLGQYQFELVGDVRYGDVSGHTGETGSDKAVFVGSCANAGKTSQVLFVYGMDDGKAARIASADLSASANTLVQSYTVGDGAIQIKANQGDPPALVTLTYALLNGSLVNLNPTTAPPATPAATTAATTTTTDESADNNAASTDAVSYESFHDQLSPYGQWIDHPSWGRVWHPTAVPADFRPYREGHWENSDEYGTVWVSDYNWGDVAFHYGRWGYDPNYGWLWQPGYVWSPAWVVWREGAGNIGWFPIPPGYYDGSTAFVDDWYGWYGYRALYGGALDAAAFYALWSFVPADDIYASSIGVDLIAPGLYAGFIGRTAGWTRFGSVGGHLVNRAIDGLRFRAAFGRPLPTASRHDFQSHHGPIVGVDRGRDIAAHQHVSVGVGMHHGLESHSGPGYVHHASSSSHVYSRGGSSGRTYGSTHTYSHSPATYSHSTAGTYSRSTAGTYSRSGGSTFSRSSTSGGFSRSTPGGFSRPTGGSSLASHSPQIQRFGAPQVPHSTPSKNEHH